MWIPGVIYPSRVKISDEALNEFIAIYKEDFGDEINRKEASEMASRLVMLYEFLAKKLPNEQISPEPMPQLDDPPRKIGFHT